MENLSALITGSSVMVGLIVEMVLMSLIAVRC